MYLSYGNSKMSLPTWSLPSGPTCLGKTPLCYTHCYARKAEQQWPRVLPCRVQNYRDSLMRYFPLRMISMIKSRRGVRYVRIHEGGDFYSQEYLDKWIYIASALPDITFLTYTKCWGLDFSHTPGNFIHFWSVWTDTKGRPPEGLRAYSGDLPPNGRVFQCPHHCDPCMRCFTTRQDVWFPLH